MLLPTPLTSRTPVGSSGNRGRLPGNRSCASRKAMSNCERLMPGIGAMGKGGKRERCSGGQKKGRRRWQNHQQRIEIKPRRRGEFGEKAKETWRHMAHPNRSQNPTLPETEDQLARCCLEWRTNRKTSPTPKNRSHRTQQTGIHKACRFSSSRTATGQGIFANNSPKSRAGLAGKGRRCHPVGGGRPERMAAASPARHERRPSPPRRAAQRLPRRRQRAYASRQRQGL